MEHINVSAVVTTKMKILIFTNKFEYLKRKKNFINKLIENGLEVLVLATNDKYSEQVKSFGCKILNIGISRKGKNPLYEIILLAKLFFILFKIKPNLILNFTIKPVIYGSIVASFLNIRVINTMTGLGTYFFDKNFFNKFFIVLFKFSQRNSDIIYSQNKDDERFLKNLNLKKTKILYNPGSGVDLKYFKETNYPKENTNFLLVSRMLWNKGIKEYVEAAKIIKKKNSKINFQLAGPIDTENEFSIPAEQIKIWVNEGYIKYLGEVQNIAQYISESSCLVLPSYREGLPRSLLEGAAMSRPIIATDVPGCRDIVKHNFNGFLCKTQDIDSLVNVLNKFISLSFEKKADMGKKGRITVEKEFNEDFVYNNYLDQIKKILRT